MNYLHVDVLYAGLEVKVIGQSASSHDEKLIVEFVF